mmetsp:Transcript_29875/g.76735  ORF Transcript_29875/g.76735 Transcript_29875/m.76735 type:complete len:564 (+) Transcript_29875:115-1806(+)
MGDAPGPADEDRLVREEEEKKSWWSRLNPWELVLWVQLLAHHFEDYGGYRLLTLLVVAQWIVKGLVYGYVAASMEWVFRDLGVPGPQLQIYKSVAMMPWSMKPIFGIASDCYPIFGYKRGPYIAIASAVGVSGHYMLGFQPLDLTGVVICLLFCEVQIAMVDLLTEARYAEAMRGKPDRGPDLVSFVWGGIMLGNLLALLTVSYIIENYGARTVFVVALVPASLIFIPTILNYIGDKPVPPEEAAQRRAFLWNEQPELLTLVAIMTVGTIFMIVVGLTSGNVWINLAVALTVGFLVIFAIAMLTRPEIGATNSFFCIQAMMAISIEGATFYFFTDTREQYPEGPHFSIWFYTSVTGIVASIFGLIGMALYTQYGKNLRYRPLIVITNLIWCVLNLVCILVYTRDNVRLGIPDELFIMSSTVLHAVVHQWMYLPGIVLLSQQCPKGLEALMYALIASSHNLGHSVSNYIGAALLVYLGVTPDGSRNESAKFKNLWIAALVQALLPAVTLILAQWLVPNALQTERLITKHVTSATAGSPYQQCTGQVPIDEGDSEYGTFSGRSQS